MKHALACALLMVGLAAMASPAFATDPVMPPPVTDDPPPPPPAADTETPPPAPVAQPVSEPVAPPVTPPACADCPAPKRYDSQEVIKKIREMDKSRVINTTEMAPAYAPRRSDNGIRVRSDKTLVVIVTHEYRVIESPGLVSASDVAPAPRYIRYRPHRAVCRHGYNRYGSCRSVLRVRG